MNLKSFFLKENIFPICLIFIMLASRLIPHPPNFTPIIAVAIMSGHLFKNTYYSLIVLLAAMLLSDFIIGFYGNMIFVYLALFFVCFISSALSKKINFKNLVFYGFAGSLIFFLISNFGVWLLGTLYEKNLAGLIQCYFMAIPFFKNTLVSTLIFVYLAFLSKSFLYDAKRIAN